MAVRVKRVASLCPGMDGMGEARTCCGLTKARFSWSVNERKVG